MMRANYAPHLKDSTKHLMEQRNKAQRTAANIGDPEDWRVFRGLRNHCVTAQRLDRHEWEKVEQCRKQLGQTLEVC